MKAALRKIVRRLRRFARFQEYIEGYDAYLCMMDELLNREIIRHITINGYQVYVRTNTSDVEVAITSLGEGEYTDIRLSDPKIIVDAGANIGTSSMFFAERFPEARIFALEPENENFRLLKMNTDRYPNVIPIQAALWKEDGVRPIQDRLTGPWGYTISEVPGKTHPTEQKIASITMETFMKKYDIETIDLLKMDIEGAEKEIFENSEGWIDRVKVITVELHDKFISGCSRAFYLATKDFSTFEKHGEKVTAYR